jgi:hypothetical protein
VTTTADEGGITVQGTPAAKAPDLRRMNAAVEAAGGVDVETQRGSLSPCYDE